ncbi:MAG: cadherin repeat domain-containing protein, partial [Pseudomonadota bacterium]
GAHVSEPTALTLTVGDAAETVRLADDGGRFVDDGVSEAAILGGAGADEVAAGAGYDRVSGGGGDDVLDGGAGVDTAVFAGALADFGVVYDAEAGAFILTDQAGAEGVDVLTGFETFEFSDLTATAEELRHEAALQANAAPEDVALGPDGLREAAVLETAPAGTVVATLTSRDADGDAVSYTLTDADGAPLDGGAFVIVGDEIRVAEGAALDAETQEAQTIHVTASDGLETSAPQALTISLTDVNDTPPVFDAPVAQATASEAAGADDVIFTAAAEDADGVGEATTYRLAEDAGGLFEIDAESGEVSLVEGASLDFETARAHQIVVEASDGTNASAQTVDIDVSVVATDDVFAGLGAGETALGGAGDDVITGADAIGQSGIVSVSQESSEQWHSVSFDAPLDDAVVVMSQNTTNEEPYTIRVRNVTEEGFEFQIDEFDYQDGVHGLETLSWVAIEAGVHTLADGTVIEAGETSASSNRTSVEFSADFDTGPVLFTQVSSDNDLSAVAERVRNIDEDGFQIQLREQERGSWHEAEDVAYIAIDASGATDSALFVHDTGDRVRDTDFAVSFDGANFDAPPVVIADMQSLDGGDTSWTSATNVTAEGVTVAIEEEQSRDSETRHTTENVGVLALEQGVLRNGEAGVAEYLGGLDDFSITYAPGSGTVQNTDHDLADGLDEGTDTVSGI